MKTIEEADTIAKKNRLVIVRVRSSPHGPILKYKIYRLISSHGMDWFTRHVFLSSRRDIAGVCKCITKLTTFDKKKTETGPPAL